jgi:hypothetical protein
MWLIIKKPETSIPRSLALAMCWAAMSASVQWVATRTDAGSVRYSSYRTSVVTLTESFSRLEAAALSGRWTGPDELFDLSESETANSVGALNSLLGERADDAASDAEVAVLRATTITTELSGFEADLDARWRGALFSLHPDNPDASRHFCTSARELLSSFLELVAPDEEVLAADPDPCARAESRFTVHALTPP